MDKLYDCLDVLMLIEIYKSLGSARNIIYHVHGDSVISSSQYQDLIHVLHDVEMCLACIHIDDCKKLESKYENNKFKEITGLS